MDLSPEQLDIAKALVAGSRTKNVQTLGGLAGTGKTFLAKYLADRLRSWAVCAFTGKASDVLRRRGLDAKTIHSTIYRWVPDDDEDDDEDDSGLDAFDAAVPFGTVPDDEDGAVAVMDEPQVAVQEEEVKGHFELKSEKELGYEGFVIDEGSMVGRDVFEDLCSFGLPIIVIGDHGQLPPVSEDAGLMVNPEYKLETIHRNAGPIAYFAQHLRNGGKASKWGGSSDVVSMIDRGRLSNEAILSADQVICSFNRTRVGLNTSIRRLHGINYRMPVVGDRVMCLRNEREVGVFNGQQGTVASIGKRHMLFRPTYGSAMSVNFNPAAWNSEKTPPRTKKDKPGRNIPFDFAYAITCHKSQGDQWPTVLVRHEKCDLWEDARWAYTAASRAEKRLIWVS